MTATNAEKPKRKVRSADIMILRMPTDDEVGRPEDKGWHVQAVEKKLKDTRAALQHIETMPAGEYMVVDRKATVKSKNVERRALEVTK